MSETQTPERFAYGANELNGCSCPAMAAGMNPSASGEGHIPGLLEAAEQYDILLENQRGEYDGIIIKEIAKGAWIDMMRNKLFEDTPEMEAAEEVAKYHGWI